MSADGRPLVLPGGSGDVGGDDVGGVPVEGGAGAVVAHGGPRVGVRGGFLHVAQRHPASSAAVMNACRSVCGPMGLPIPACRPTRRTIWPAPCRSSRRPSAVTKIGPWCARRWPGRSPARSAAPAGWSRPCRPCGSLPGSGGRARLRVPRCSRRWPRIPAARSMPAARSARARQAGRVRPRRAARRARFGPGQRRGIHSPAGAAAHGLRASGREVLPRRRSGRTRRLCTAAG